MCAHLYIGWLTRIGYTLHSISTKREKWGKRVSEQKRNKKIGTLANMTRANVKQRAIDASCCWCSVLMDAGNLIHHDKPITSSRSLLLLLLVALFQGNHICAHLYRMNRTKRTHPSAITVSDYCTLHPQNIVSNSYSVCLFFFLFLSSLNWCHVCVAVFFCFFFPPNPVEMGNK